MERFIASKRIKMKQSRLTRNVWLGIENLLMHKMRSTLTMLGVVFGVGSVVAMLAVGEGASQEALDQIKKLGSNNIIINSKKSTEDSSQSQSFSRVNIYGLTYSDFDQISHSFDDLKISVPVKAIEKTAYYESNQTDIRLIGTNPEWFNLVERTLIAGRRFNQQDFQDYNSVVVLSEKIAREIFTAQAPIGNMIKIGGDYFEVIGIVKSEPSSSGNLQMPDSLKDVYMPLPVVRKYFGDMFTKISSGSRIRELVELHKIIVQVNALENVQKTSEAITRMMSLTHKKDDYEINVPLALLRQAESTKRTFNIVLGSIAGISLLVGGIGIMNIMLASVTERTREIGIRRAIGAKRNQIIYQFLIETIVLSTLGGIIGLGVGVLIPLMITYFAGMPTVITPFSIVLPLFISVFIGIVFGIYPAANAASVDPIVALRHE